MIRIVAMPKALNLKLLCAAALLAAVGGCGKSGLDKVVVSGDVTFLGEPIKNGEIYFYPTGNTKGPVSGASVKDGHYEAIGKGGVPLGTHRVVIRGFRAAANSASAAAAAKAGLEGGIREQYLPAKFNDKSTLEVTISDESASSGVDFTLEK
jgi:hypothetical protein